MKAVNQYLVSGWGSHSFGDGLVTEVKNYDFNCNSDLDGDDTDHNEKDSIDHDDDTGFKHTSEIAVVSPQT